MAVVKGQTIFFEGDVTGVAKVRIRIHDAGTDPSTDDPFQDFDVPTKSDDGKYRIPVSSITALEGFEGETDFAVSFVDAAGNESDMLDKDNAVFDQSPPTAPTAVGLE